jgi:hypothetical protein
LGLSLWILGFQLGLSLQPLRALRIGLERNDEQWNLTQIERSGRIV